MMIIGISGLCIDAAGNRRSVGSGKGVVAKRLVDKHAYVDIAFADPLKRICKEVFRFSDEQLWGESEDRMKPDLRYLRTVATGEYLTPRYALQTLGSDWGRGCCKDIWATKCIEVVQTLLRTPELRYTPSSGLYLGSGPQVINGVAISDMRFFNESSVVSKAGGKLVRVRRVLSSLFDLDSMNHWHDSELELINMPDESFDYVIDNCGTVDTLQLMVDTMLDVFSGKIIPFDESQENVPPFKRKCR